MADAWVNTVSDAWMSTSVDGWFGLTVAEPVIPAGVTTRYYFTLTGDRDGIADVIIPISSFQAQLKSGEPSYLTVTIPDALTWADAIADRPNGRMVIEGAYLYAGVDLSRTEILWADLDDVRIDRGARSTSITLTGRKTRDYSLNRAMTVEGATYYSLQSGLSRLRAMPHFTLRPCDAIMFEGEEIRIGSISWSVSASYATMEIVESGEDLNTEYTLSVNTNVGIS